MCSPETDVPLNLSLTAQAVIALKMNKDITGPIKEELNNAIDRGRIWLEKHYRVRRDLGENLFQILIYVSANRRCV